MEKFRKPLNELFEKTKDSYKVIGDSVKINETLFTTDRLSIQNDLLDKLFDKEVGGEIHNDVFLITCYFEGEELINIQPDHDTDLF